MSDFHSRQPRPFLANESLIPALKRNVKWMVSVILACWALEVLDTMMLGFFDRFGIQPRRWAGIPGILTAPWIHGGFAHLASNTVSFVVLGGMVLMSGRRLFNQASLIIIVLGGGMLWAMGPANTNHIGASLLIFGYLGWLIARGCVQRSPLWISISLLTLFFYGGMLQGVLPGVKGVSWQGHLAGFLAGIVAARLMFSRRPGGNLPDEQDAFTPRF